MPEISISHFISVTVASQAIGLKQANLSTIALITNETSSNVTDPYVVYRNATAVATDWGTSSEVYKQATAIFSQSPNVLTASGYVVVIPMLPSVTTNATSGYAITSQEINVTPFTSIENGAFDITVDGGSVIQISGLNFSSVATVENLATLINTALTTATAGATCVADGSKVKFISSSTGITSSILISTATASGTLTDISGSSYLNASQMVRVTGTNAYTGREKLVDTVIRTKPLIYFHAVLPCLALDYTEIKSASDYIQTQEMMLGYASNASADVAESGNFDLIRSASNKNTRCFAYFSADAIDARIALAAYFGRLLCVNFEGSNTTLSMQLKSLSGITADENMTETLFDRCEVVGADCYCSVDGISCCVSNGANEYIDNVYNDHWLITALQVAGFNSLRQANTKIPQTQAGVDVLVTAFKNVLVRGVNNGSFAPGSWGLADTFGDPELFNINIETFGYYIYATPLAQQSQSERDARKAPFISIAVKRAGAIHSSNIIVYVNN